jgi:hypothetical protein
LIYGTSKIQIKVKREEKLLPTSRERERRMRGESKKGKEIEYRVKG